MTEPRYSPNGQRRLVDPPCELGHKYQAMECPGCSERLHGEKASAEWWAWYRRRYPKAEGRPTVTDPVRVQRRRTKGWKMPENTVSVGRPSKWGNNFIVGVSGTASEAVAHYRRWISGGYIEQQIRRELRGKNLACWCPLDQPCHADVLLEIANE